MATYHRHYRAGQADESVYVFTVVFENDEALWGWMSRQGESHQWADGIRRQALLLFKEINEDGNCSLC